MNVEEIARELDEIESIYFTKNIEKYPRLSSDLLEGLIVLSKEFDSLGLTSINCRNTLPNILEQVVKCSRDLVQIHRNAVNQIKDKNIESRNKDVRKNRLYNMLEESKDSLEKYQDNCLTLQNKTHKLNNEIKELLKRENAHKEEFERLKRYHSSKQKELEHTTRKLKLENERLKEIFGKDIVKKNSTNEVALNLLKKYKLNEEIYKSTIKKLQENNKELLEEILTLKEIVLSSSNA